MKLKNTLSTATRAWLQLVRLTVSIGVGLPTLDNKKSIPESWVVGHVPIYLGLEVEGRLVNICLTDLTEEELNQFQALLNKAIDVALPICRALDEEAYKVLERGDDLDLIPNRALRGSAPQVFRPIDTVLKMEDLTAEDREVVEPYLKRERI